jgi:predicted ATP-dependent serine protease
MVGDGFGGCSRQLGRKAETEVLDSIVGRLQVEGAEVLISGVAGIGKSALALDFFATRGIG